MAAAGLRAVGLHDRRKCHINSSVQERRQSRSSRGYVGLCLYRAKTRCRACGQVFLRRAKQLVGTR
jgi:hypothetical protein